MAHFHSVVFFTVVTREYSVPSYLRNEKYPVPRYDIVIVIVLYPNPTSRKFSFAKDFNNPLSENLPTFALPQTRTTCRTPSHSKVPPFRCSVPNTAKTTCRAASNVKTLGFHPSPALQRNYTHHTPADSEAQPHFPPVSQPSVVTPVTVCRVRGGDSEGYPLREREGRRRGGRGNRHVGVQGVNEVT